MITTQQIPTQVRMIYIETTVPEGITLPEYRRNRALDRKRKLRGRITRINSPRLTA